LFRKVMTEQERKNTISNYVASMSGINGPKRDEIISRQLNHFHKADKELAMKVAEGLKFNFKP
jgi:catalase